MPSVLLVDDDTSALEMRKLILEKQGHQVVAVDYPSQARAQFKKAVPEIVILDLHLPDLEDGLALIREFRGASPCIKIIVLSGRCEDLTGRGENDMVDLILSKPVRSEVLLNAIRV